MKVKVIPIEVIVLETVFQNLAMVRIGNLWENHPDYVVAETG